MPTTLSALGVYPLGFGAPVEAPAPPTGQSQLCRYIHPGERDYKINAEDGHFQSMPIVRQRVLLALLTVYRSSTVLPKMGVDHGEKMGDGFERAEELRTREALRQLTDVEKVMRIDAVIIGRLSTGRASVLIVYTDLTTGLPDKVSNADLEALKWA